MSAQATMETRCTFVHPNGWRCILEHRHTGSCRKHPEPQVGDVFGNVKILALGRGDVRLDLRAEVECMTCGARGHTYVFNLRNRPPPCTKRGGCNR